MTHNLFNPFHQNLHVFSCCQAGYFSAFKDGIVWGLIPSYFSSFSLDLHYVAFLIAVYPFTWAVVQLFSGSLYDSYGAKWLIASGLWYVVKCFGA